MNLNAFDTYFVDRLHVRKKNEGHEASPRRRALEIRRNITVTFLHLLSDFTARSIHSSFETVSSWATRSGDGISFVAGLYSIAVTSEEIKVPRKNDEEKMTRYYPEF